MSRRNSRGSISSDDDVLRDEVEQCCKKLQSKEGDHVVAFTTACALYDRAEDAYHAGKLFVTRHCVCFYCKQPEIKQVVPLSEISAVLKEHKSLKRGIKIYTPKQAFFFASFPSSNKAYMNVVCLWAAETKGPAVSAVPAVSSALGSSSPVGSSCSSDSSSDDSDIVSWSTQLSASEDSKLDVTSQVSKQKEILRERFTGLSVNAFFDLFFANNAPFTALIHQDIQDTELTVTEWANHPVLGLARKKRFRAAVKHSMPCSSSLSSTRVEETQVYHKQRDGLLIESWMALLDTSHSDAFQLESQWHVNAYDNGNSCELVVTQGIRFLKRLLLKGVFPTPTCDSLTSAQEGSKASSSSVARNTPLDGWR
eukprot:TRINITY_DN4885_c0_g1_i2.p1 TRINITY_DN4885_c0_g1~~TRINITY_DN4885_c0_g1_i2.p1  ORF type:complete len:367 (+),score=73.68 TRINITY_DN4885_c0_g1_i2:106-1206(+)